MSISISKIIVWLIVVKGQYKSVEKVFLAASFFYFAYIIAGVLAWSGSRSATADGWLRAAFLTVAWFWLLLPTLNPWYWSWAMPLVVFARGRAWLAVSGLALMYYLRCWLVYHFSDVPLLGTGYTGPSFFDYVVTWFEFGPWFVWLMIDAVRDRYSARGRE